mmetsp:Transcript_50507/g.93399  ORF Transcript_50507/g.93399 Transcript_50507/m.93399 type:complete len:240 (-) Transcript_50507:701-1420(-)
MVVNSVSRIAPERFASVTWLAWSGMLASEPSAALLCAQLGVGVWKAGVEGTFCIPLADSKSVLASGVGSALSSCGMLFAPDIVVGVTGSNPTGLSFHEPPVKLEAGRRSFKDNVQLPCEECRQPRRTLLVRRVWMTFTTSFKSFCEACALSCTAISLKIVSIRPTSVSTKWGSCLQTCCSESTPRNTSALGYWNALSHTTGKTFMLPSYMVLKSCRTSSFQKMPCVQTSTTAFPRVGSS